MCGQICVRLDEQKSYPQTEETVRKVVLTVIHTNENFFVYECKDYSLALPPPVAINVWGADRVGTFCEVSQRRGDLFISGPL